MPSWVPRLAIRDPGLASLRSAGRAAIVMPAIFAVADRVIDDPRVATFAAFGSFAMLTLVEFGGPMRSRLVAYLALAGAGAANIFLGTLCSGNAWLAAGAMALVALGISLSGMINGYFAAAGTATMLTFILAVMIPAPFSAVPSRLEGWALAAAGGITAQMVLWPLRPQISLRAAAARACLALASLAETALGAEAELIGDRSRAARAAVSDIRRRFLATPHRPTGATGRQAALNSLVDELDWLLSFLAPLAPIHHPHVCEREHTDAVAAAVDALRVAAARLDGGNEEPDIRRLDETRRASAHALAKQLPSLPTLPDHRGVAAEVERAFRIRILSYGARAIAMFAVAASGRRPAQSDDELLNGTAVRRLVRSKLQATEQLTAQHASVRSVWFRNGLRAAAGLTIAVFVAQVSGLQHAFWVVLGTSSVLRSNALGTGWSIVSALLGTALGIVIGAAVVVGIGTHQAVLWAVLPVAVLLASYAPRAISFAAGQAGFTVVLVVLFNIIQPSGWTVGLVRIEDVAIGFAISLGVGLLFWPRGVAALLRESLASAYARHADYVAAAHRQLVHGSDPATTYAAAETSAGAEHRLDDAYRQYLLEPPTAGDQGRRAAALVSGAGRLRRGAESLAALATMNDGVATLERCGGNLDAEVHALHSWYVTLGDALIQAAAIPAPHTPDVEGRRQLIDCVRDAVSEDRSKIRAGLNLLWASQHLDALWQEEKHLEREAAQVTVRGEPPSSPPPVPQPAGR